MVKKPRTLSIFWPVIVVWLVRLRQRSNVTHFHPPTLRFNDLLLALESFRGSFPSCIDDDRNLVDDVEEEDTIRSHGCIRPRSSSHDVSLLLKKRSMDMTHCRNLVLACRRGMQILRLGGCVWQCRLLVFHARVVVFTSFSWFVLNAE
jgi:hypothetical protein